jgi:hypothetical protein
MIDRSERSAALTGVTAVVLWVVGILVLEKVADQPDTSATPAQALAYFENHDQAILAGTFAFMLGAIFFLWFLGTLRAHLFEVEGGSRRLAGTAFAGGVIAAASLLFMEATQAAGVLNKKGLSPEAAQVYRGIGDAFFYATELPAAVLILAVGLLVLRTRAWPAWLGWASLAVALWLLIPPIGWLALITGFPLWVVVVSLLLYSRAAATTPAAP